MRHEPKEEGMRWLMQAGWDLDDARYNFEGKRFNLYVSSLNRLQKKQ